MLFASGVLYCTEEKEDLDIIKYYICEPTAPSKMNVFVTKISKPFFFTSNSLPRKIQNIIRRK